METIIPSKHSLPTDFRADTTAAIRPRPEGRDELLVWLFRRQESRTPEATALMAGLQAYRRTTPQGS